MNSVSCNGAMYTINNLNFPSFLKAHVMNHLCSLFPFLETVVRILMHMLRRVLPSLKSLRWVLFAHALMTILVPCQFQVIRHTEFLTLKTPKYSEQTQIIEPSA